MTGYELVHKLRKTRRRYPLTATEQALFHELVAICNEEEWPDTFTCSNYELCSVLQISENTLVAARNILIQGGLIAYKSGKSKRQHSSYSFYTTSNNEVDTATNAAPNRGGNAAGDTATNAADINKTKKKRKTKLHSEANASGANAPAGSSNDKEEEERKKGSGQKKKEEDTTPYWHILVQVWFEFNKTNLNGFVPSFKDQDPKSLKKICDNLQARAVKKGNEWSEEKATEALAAFFSHAFKEEWLKDNFLLPNLDRQFDKIISNAINTNTGANGTAGTSQAGRQANPVRSRGATIGELDGLKRDGEAGDKERTEFTTYQVVD